MKKLLEMLIEMIPEAVEALKEDRKTKMEKGSALAVDVAECNRVTAAIQALVEYKDELGCPGV